MGRAEPSLVWERYADLDAWPGWAPLIVAVECEDDRLRTGATGTVRGPGGLPVRFAVEACDHAARRWRWLVRAGPLELVLDHEVLARPGGGSVATLSLEGPWPVLLAYLPMAQLALQRLVTP